MPILTIQQIKDKFGSGKNPRSEDYEDLIDTLSSVEISATAPISYNSETGNISIDLSAYDTSSEVDTKLSNYDTSSEVDTKLSSYDTSSEVNSKILDIEEAMIVAITDEVSEVTTGSSKVSFRFPFDAILYQNPRASLSTASNANTVVDINKNGSSILSTKLSIDSSEKTSVSASSSAVLSTTSINSDDELTFDVDSTGNNGIGLKVTIFYKRV